MAQKIVRFVLHKFVHEGKGTHVIPRELREAGIKPMRVKEWQKTVILRILRNEKYCGDLVQKKTYTPDYLSHDKKYNRGEEEFVILRDHHEAIISRELFESANHILDDRALFQEDKAKHSSRYCFSGKIKCGICDCSYVTRYKTRENGSQYKVWRCMESAKNGSQHVDKAGNHVGCKTESIRNEDALHIMSLVAGSLEMDRVTIVKNMISVIQSVVSCDMQGANIGKLRKRIEMAEEKKSRLLELYMSKDVSRDELIAARTKCDAEIEELHALITSIQKQDVLIKQQNELILDITKAVNEIVEGITFEEEFYKNLLDRMVVHDKDHINVFLDLLPHKWSFTVAKTKIPPNYAAYGTIIANRNFCGQKFK